MILFLHALCTKSYFCLDESLLVRSSEVTSVMDIVFKQESLGDITRQHSITQAHFLSGWLPFHRLFLHNWTVGGKVHTIISDFVKESVAFHSGKTEVTHTELYQAKIQEEKLINGMIGNRI